MQRHLKLLAAAAAAVVLAACSQGSVPTASAPPEPAAPTPAVASSTPAEVEAAVTQLERDWVAAIVKKDADALDKLLAAEFTGTSPTAHNYTKEMAIGDLKSGTYVVTAMDLDEISVNPYGDVAVAFTSQEEKSTYGGKSISGHYHYTDVWVKKDGRWQAVASHGTLYDKGHVAN